MRLSTDNIFHLAFSSSFFIIVLMTKIFLLCILLVTISFLCLFPCLGNDFVNWDDDVYIVKNPDIRELTIKNLNRIFSHFYAGAYVPLTIFSFALDHQIAGLNPLPYHITNLILHLINTLLIFWVIYLLSKRLSISFLTALFFAIHPLHIEPVAWVTGRKDLLYGFFFVGSVISYIYYKKYEKNRFYFFSIVLFILALFSKPVAITLPFVLLILEYFIFHRLDRNVLNKLVPLFLLSIFFFIVAVTAQKSAGAFPEVELNLLQQINISFSNFLFYLSKFFVPVRLSCIYPVQNYWFAPLLVLIIIGGILISLRWTRIVALLMILFLIMLLPTLQLFPVGQILSDRYTYLGLTGLCYLISSVFFELYQIKKNVIRYFTILMIFISSGLFFLLSNRQCRVWKDGFTLWNYVIEIYPDIPLAYNNRGILHSNNKEYHLALKDFDRAISLNPVYLNAYMNRGNIYGSLGDYDRALSDYYMALGIDSTYIDVYHNRAVIYFNKREYRAALNDLLKIRKLGGDVPDEVIGYIKELADKEHNE